MMAGLVAVPLALDLAYCLYLPYEKLLPSPHAHHRYGSFEPNRIYGAYCLQDRALARYGYVQDYWFGRSNFGVWSLFPV